MAVTSEQLPAQLPPESKDRDASRLRADDFPLRELPAIASKREKRYQVVIQQSVMDDIHAHGESTSEVEICGLLLGNVYHDAKGPWCLIDASVRGNYSAGKQTQVTITSETWTHVNEVRDREFPDKKFIGWYHTHPGFGIFLSGMDDFIQVNWFSEPSQIALVYDPKSKEEGVFIWRAGKTVSEPFLILPKDGGPAVCAGQLPPAVISDSKLPSGTLGELMSRLQAVEQRQRWLLVAMGAIGLIAMVWPLALFLWVSGAGIHVSPKTADPGEHDSTTLPAAVRAPTNLGS